MTPKARIARSVRSSTTRLLTRIGNDGLAVYGLVELPAQELGDR